MKFGKKSIINAEGSILAHTLRLKASIIKKGTILSANDIKILGDEGYKDLMVASLEIDDIGENDAAKELALTTAGLGVIAGKPFTGRCNLFASYSGLFIAEKKLIDSINLVDESMTLGTLAPYSAVETGQMVATIKVIPFSAPKSVVLECNTIARKKSNLLEVKPWKELRISLIQSILPKTKTTVLKYVSVYLLGSALFGFLFILIGSQYYY